jgi:lactococcin 972 family bacteriocin
MSIDSKVATMRLNSRVAATVLVTGALAIGATLAAGPASAYVSYPEGGTWDYGNSGRTWSNYHHPRNVHRSTACNSQTCQRSLDTGSGKWSAISVPWTISGNTWYYYNYYYFY